MVDVNTTPFEIETVTRHGDVVRADVYLPTGAQGPFPVLFGASPYQKSLRRLPAVPQFAFIEYGPMQLYLDEGYAYVAMDVPGTGRSEGTWDPVSRAEGEAVHDMGALPALIWAADHPHEVAGLLYIEAPVMLGDVLRQIIAYTPEAMKEGSMWWWVLPLAPGVPDRLVVGNERAFLTWFYERATAHPDSIGPAAVDEYLRTFSGREGVLGAMGIYRAAFTSIAQTEPLAKAKVRMPVVAMGGVKGLGAKVGEMAGMVADTVEKHVLPDCGHFLPEERPEEVVRHVLAMAASQQGASR